ncbi:MAG: SBBP repeat-containing protein, partial [Dehalococcoidia bacterium]|nr:SBBP repeat-containing protein [Dehalococcoidia bacterium]
MIHVLLSLMLLLMVFLPGTIPLAATAYHEPSAGSAGEALKAKALEVYGELPLLFIENQGQLDAEVRYYVKAAGQTVYLTDDGIVFDLIRYQHEITGVSDLADRQAERLVFSLDFVGASESLTVQSRDRGKAAINYFIGSNPEKWYADVPSYKEVVYQSIYPGIDLRLYGNAGLLQYDFIVAPGANVSDIALAYSGIDRLTLQGGQLVAGTPLEEIKQSHLYIYQQIGERKVVIDGAFTLVNRNTYGFKVADYDAGYPIIIDPTLIYSSFFGGAYNDFGIGITVDSSGCAYITGGTHSIDFPVKNACQATGGGTALDVFVAKIDTIKSGDDSLIYSTYLGGSENDAGDKIAVDSSGCAYISGGTGSTDFPTQNAYQAASGGGSDVFVTKLSATGDVLLYSTYLGGSARDARGGIAIDSSGCAYISGTTGSTDFPTLNAYQAAIAGGSDAFISKLNASGTALVYSTYLGGSAMESAVDVDVDANQCAYIAGITTSTDFPIMNPFQTDQGGPDIFITKLNAAGSALVYSTYLGGSGYDGYVGSSKRGGTIFGGIAVDQAGCAYVAGLTTSTDFPTRNAYDSTLRGPRDAFITKLNTSGSALDYSTYLGGSDGDWAQDIAVDSSGYAYVTGVTKSKDFPTRSPLQVLGEYSEGDPFISKIDTEASGTSSLIFSTYLGSTVYDGGYGIAVDTSGYTYVTGFTSGADFPTENGYQPTRPYSPLSQCDAFISKIDTPLANNPPYMPSCPWPQDNSTAVSANVTLSWTGGDPDAGDNVTYDVYLGSSPPWLGLPLVAQDLVGTTYDPPLDLIQNSRYHWKVVARDNHGAQSFGTNEVFFTTSIPPRVTTEEVTNIEPENASENATFQATLNGNLTSLGSGSSAIVRFVWGMDTTEGIGQSIYWTGFQTLDTTGPFSADIRGLQPGTIYWCQAHTFPAYSWMMDTWGFFKTFTTGVATVTGTGAATFLTDYGAVTEATAIDEATLPTTGKPDVIFPHGLFSFTISDIPVGSSVTVTLTLPSEVPEGTEYWKYDAVQGWVEMTSLMGDNDGDNVLTLTLTDGGPGDGDGVADGTIVDPGGPGVPAVTPAIPAPTPTIPAPTPTTPAPRASPSPPRPLAPPSLTLKYLNINPQQVYTNQPVTIST